MHQCLRGQTGDEGRQVHWTGKTWVGIAAQSLPSRWPGLSEPPFPHLRLLSGSQTLWIEPPSMLPALPPAPLSHSPQAPEDTRVTKTASRRRTTARVAPLQTLGWPRKE